jgi:hypothetical protein
MNKEFDAVNLVREIRDDIYEQTKEMSAAELVEFFRLRSASAKEKLVQLESRHVMAAQHPLTRASAKTRSSAR